jgi:hypothetical protein
MIREIMEMGMNDQKHYRGLIQNTVYPGICPEGLSKNDQDFNPA